MHTLGTLIDRHGVDVLDHLDRQVTVPVLAGIQAQGDVLVHPILNSEDAIHAVPELGYPVMRGENGGNTHLLLAEGAVRFNPAGDGMVLGVLTVPAGAVGWLAHPEHGYLGIAPGQYELRRQREQRDEIALVRD